MKYKLGLLLITLIMTIGTIDAHRSHGDTSDQNTTVCDVLAHFPNSYLAILPPNARLDMIDYLKADSLVHVRNAYRGESWIMEHNPTYLKVHITNASTLQIKQLTDSKGQKIFMAIYTISAEDVVADSQILFFDGNVKELETRRYFRLPDPKSFWKTPADKIDKEERKELEKAVPFYAIEYSASPESDLLIGRISSISYLSEEMKAKVAPMMLKEMIWQWDGKRFEKQ
ncbi:MAG: DUF3256 family protein [Muribaculaceae bacterium]|nr:DUF3256 family protein [Muribaculaceae bacterium]